MDLSLKKVFPTYTGMGLPEFKKKYDLFKSKVQDYYNNYAPKSTEDFPMVAEVIIAGGLDFFVMLEYNRHLIRYPGISVLRKDYFVTAPKKELEFLTFDEMLVEVIRFCERNFEYVEAMRKAVEEAKEHPVEIDFPFGSLPSSSTAQPCSPPKKVEFSGYAKGHSIPEGTYLVELISVKKHNPTTYRLEVKVLNSFGYLGEPEVITGYANRFSNKSHYDIAGCFGDGEVYPTTKEYVGQKGVISLSSSGWITLMGRTIFAGLFPNAKAVVDPTYNPQESFQKFLDMYNRKYD